MGGILKGVCKVYDCFVLENPNHPAPSLNRWGHPSFAAQGGETRAAFFSKLIWPLSKQLIYGCMNFCKGELRKILLHHGGYFVVA
jgi:hypothetical protein